MGVPQSLVLGPFQVVPSLWSQILSRREYPKTGVPQDRIKVSPRKVKGIRPGTVMQRVVCLLRFHTGGLLVVNYFD